MLERKLYKTKLCILYQRGRCNRQSCSFAHGEAELRRFAGGSFGARREYRGNDLREKLGRRYSPRRRYSPGRRRHAFHGNSRSRSPLRRSERRDRRKQHVDGHSDASGSHKFSDAGEDHVREGKVSSYDDKNAHDEQQLKQVKLDLEMLDEHKCQLEIALEEKSQEAESLKSRIEELEVQLNREQEEYRRVSSKVNKFIKAYKRYSRVQEQLKRTQARFYRLGDRFSLDSSGNGGNEEDSSVNIVSDGEPSGGKGRSPGDRRLKHFSPARKRLRASQGANEDGKLDKREFAVGMSKVDKYTQQSGPLQLESMDKDSMAWNRFSNGNINNRAIENEERGKQGRNASSILAAMEKYRVDEVHADVEGLETAEVVGKSDVEI